MSLYPEVAADFDPRTIVIRPQDVIYKTSQLAGLGDVTLTDNLRENVAGLYELASVLAKMPSPTPFPRPSAISPDMLLRFAGKANDATSPQATLVMPTNPSSSEEVSLNDGTGARAYSFAADGDVVVPIGSDIAQSARNLVNAINVDREAGNADLYAAYLGQDLFGTTGAFMVFLIGTSSEWDDNDTATTDITGATVTGFTLGVAP